MEYYKLCYVEGNKAWFSNNFEKQWGDDWNDKPYECNAGEPYDHWLEEIPHKPPIYEKQYKSHEIKHKILFFEVLDWIDQRPCDMGRYSVEDINKQAVAWIHTDKFNILAGTTYENFIDIIEKNDGIIYLPKEEYKK